MHVEYRGHKHKHRTAVSSDMAAPRTGFLVGGHGEDRAGRPIAQRPWPRAQWGSIAEARAARGLVVVSITTSQMDLIACSRCFNHALVQAQRCGRQQRRRCAEPSARSRGPCSGKCDLRSPTSLAVILAESPLDRLAHSPGGSLKAFH